MGKGDIKTKKGKLNNGSYGVSRRRADNNKKAAPKVAVQFEPVEEKKEPKTKKAVKK